MRNPWKSVCDILSPIKVKSYWLSQLSLRPYQYNTSSVTMNAETLRAIYRAQKRRWSSVSDDNDDDDDTTGMYLSRMITISKVIVKNPELHYLLEGNAPTYHIGEANKIVKLKFPVTSAGARDLFTAIPVDNDTLPPRTRRFVTMDLINSDVGPDVCHLGNRRREGRCSVASQAYQNYISAFQWWHEYDNPLWNKVGCVFDRKVGNVLLDQIHGNKNVVPKKRDGMMYAEGNPALATAFHEELEKAKKMTEELKQLNEKYIELSNTIDKNHEEVKNMFSKLRGTIVEEIVKHLEVKGAVPVTRDITQEILFNTKNKVNGSLQRILDGQNVINERLKSLEGHPSTDSSSGAPAAMKLILAGNDSFGDVYRGMYHLWPGIDNQFHNVYAGFKWPSETAFVMWELWWRGDPNKKVCPYRHIDSRNDLTSTKCRTRRTKTLKVINVISDIAINKALISSMTGINSDNSTEIFDTCYSYLITQLYVGAEGHVVRASDLNICTLANRVYSKML
jgi:hypothetical protein